MSRIQDTRTERRLIKRPSTLCPRDCGQGAYITGDGADCIDEYGIDYVEQHQQRLRAKIQEVHQLIDSGKEMK